MDRHAGPLILLLIVVFALLNRGCDGGASDAELGVNCGPRMVAC